MDYMANIRDLLGDSKMTKFERTPGHAHFSYRIEYEPVPKMVDQLTATDGAYIADDGSLFYGGRNFGKQVIGNKLIFTGIVYTD